jgi:hypothetical protein
MHWWRFHAGQGTTNWDALNDIVGLPGYFSEEDYQKFVFHISTNNHDLLAVEYGNTWL